MADMMRQTFFAQYARVDGNLGGFHSDPPIPASRFSNQYTRAREGARSEQRGTGEKQMGSEFAKEMTTMASAEPLPLQDQLDVVMAMGLPASMLAEAEEEMLAAAFDRDEGLAASDRIRARFERYLGEQFHDRPGISARAIHHGVTLLMTDCLNRVEKRVMTGAPRKSEEDRPLLH